MSECLNRWVILRFYIVIFHFYFYILHYSALPFLMNHHFPSSIKNTSNTPRVKITAKSFTDIEVMERILPNESNKNARNNSPILKKSENKKNGLLNNGMRQKGCRRLRSEYAKNIESSASPINISVRIWASS